MLLHKLTDNVKHLEHIDVKSEVVRASSVGGMVGVSQVAENGNWVLADYLVMLTILYTLLQIGLLILKYRDYFRKKKANEAQCELD